MYILTVKKQMYRPSWELNHGIFTLSVKMIG